MQGQTTEKSDSQHYQLKTVTILSTHALDTRGAIVQARGLRLELTEEDAGPIFPSLHCAMCREDSFGHTVFTQR